MTDDITTHLTNALFELPPRHPAFAHIALALEEINDNDPVCDECGARRSQHDDGECSREAA